MNIFNDNIKKVAKNLSLFLCSGLKKNVNPLFSFSKKVIEKSIYYMFYVDLVVLGFFCRGSNFLLYVFIFTYGGFGHNENDPNWVVLLKFVCVLFSFYLISTSILLLIVFNVPFTRDYLYKILGRDFVVSRIGNPGTQIIKKILSPTAVILGVNEGGKYVANSSNCTFANKTLAAQRDFINESKDLTSDEIAVLEKQALYNHSTTCAKRVTKGPIDHMVRADMVNTAVKKTSSAVKSWSWWKK